jgi:Copper binding proteins, plastocyanin/azurin family
MNRASLALVAEFHQGWWWFSAMSCELQHLPLAWSGCGGIIRTVWQSQPLSTVRLVQRTCLCSLGLIARRTIVGVHSGFIVSAPQERHGLAQAPLGVTRFRVTFTKPGTYPYLCALHYNLGMKGQIIVLP